MKDLKLKTLNVLFLILMHAIKLNAQIPNLLWANAIGATGDDASTGQVIDALGNVYTIGTFELVVDFDPSSNFNFLGSSGAKDIFITKYSPIGQLIWVKIIGDIGNDLATSIAFDNSNRLIIAGTFQNKTDFNPNNDTNFLTAFAGSDCFILKLDTAGNFIWVKQIGGLANESIRAMTVDNAGNILTTGRYSGIVDFDPSSSSFTLQGTDYIFISKLDSLGNFVWARSFDVNPSGASAIATSAAGDVYTAGYFAGTTDFDPGVDTFNLYSMSVDAYVSKLDAGGNFIWAKQIVGSGNGTFANALKLDNSGGVYIGGDFRGITDFDPDAGVSNLTAIGTNDGYILKLNTSGSFIWVKAIAGILNTSVSKLAIDNSNNFYAAGLFSGTTDLNPNIGSNPTTSNGGLDVYILRLDPIGNFVWGRNIGGSMNDYINALNLDTQKNIYVTGRYEGTCDFDPNSSVYNLVSNGLRDAYFLKWNQNPLLTENQVLNVQNEIDVYPNPCNSVLNLKCSKTTSLQFYNQMGETIETIEVSANSKYIMDVSRFSTGIYFMKITTENKSEYKKIIIAKQ